MLIFWKYPMSLAFSVLLCYSSNKIWIQVFIFVYVFLIAFQKQRKKWKKKVHDLKIETKTIKKSQGRKTWRWKPREQKSQTQISPIQYKR
jgi:predicted membrane protein